MSDDTSQDTTPAPEEDGPAARQLPEPVEGSGRYAVFSPELGNYVSGVMSKAEATKASKAMKADSDAITHGHKLVVQEV